MSYQYILGSEWSSSEEAFYSEFWILSGTGYSWEVYQIFLLGKVWQSLSLDIWVDATSFNPFTPELKKYILPTF